MRLLRLRGTGKNKSDKGVKRRKEFLLNRKGND